MDSQGIPFRAVLDSQQSFCSIFPLCYTTVCQNKKFKKATCKKKKVTCNQSIFISLFKNSFLLINLLSYLDMPAVCVPVVPPAIWETWI